MTSKMVDTGVASTPTARVAVFAAGEPASTATVDYGTETNTVARPDTANPSSVLFTNPPSAPAGSA